MATGGAVGLSDLRGRSSTRSRSVRFAPVRITRSIFGLLRQEGLDDGDAARGGVVGSVESGAADAGGDRPGLILDAVEVTAAHLPEAERLRFAGDALLQIAELCEARAGVLMTQWEESCRDPIVEQGFFADVVRQTMAVDLSDLMEPARPRQRRIKSPPQPEGSIVAPVDKAAVLAMVDQLEAEDEVAQKQSVLAIAHSEDVTQWAAAIAH